MRSIRQIIFICVLSFITLSTHAKETKFDWNPIIDAIAQVESKGNPKAVNANGNCVGLLQITPVLVRECNNILKQRGSSKRYTYNDRYSAAKSKEMFVLFQSQYNKENNVEKAIRSWNGGLGYKKNPRIFRKTTSYYNKVMKVMRMRAQ